MTNFEKDINDCIRKNLKSLREINGFNQDMIGDLLGVDRSTCSNWERGKSTPKNTQLHTLSRLYNVSVDFIMSDHDNEFFLNSPPLQRVFGESFLSGLTDDERMIILKYRVLSDEDRERVDEYITTLRGNAYYNKTIADDLETE